ncbi:MAG: hypothetical protein ACKN98_01490, partial [Candidatus Limnocylindrus sp.]
AERLPLPGTSFLKERSIVIEGRAAGEIRAGATQPSTLTDGWWIALFWVQDGEGVVSCREVAPLAGPPRITPLERYGVLMTNGLGDLLAVEDGRSCLKVRLVGDAVDPSEPWRRPLAMQVAAKWDSLRIATMSGSKVAEAALDAFARAVEVAHKP